MYGHDAPTAESDISTAGLALERPDQPAASVYEGVADQQPDPKRLKLWQPRLGIVYEITGHGTSVIRASARPFDVRTTRSRGLFGRDRSDATRSIAM
jgi:hypothetical protein